VQAARGSRQQGCKKLVGVRAERSIRRAPRARCPRVRPPGPHAVEQSLGSIGGAEQGREHLAPEPSASGDEISGGTPVPATFVPSDSRTPKSRPTIRRIAGRAPLSSAASREISVYGRPRITETSRESGATEYPCAGHDTSGHRFRLNVRYRARAGWASSGRLLQLARVHSLGGSRRCGASVSVVMRPRTEGPEIPLRRRPHSMSTGVPSVRSTALATLASSRTCVSLSTGGPRRVSSTQSRRATIGQTVISGLPSARP